MLGFNDEGLIVIVKKCFFFMYLDVMGCFGVIFRGVREVVKYCERLREINLNWCRGMGYDIVVWMVFLRFFLRKIVFLYGWLFIENEKSLFLRYGC